MCMKDEESFNVSRDYLEVVFSTSSPFHAGVSRRWKLTMRIKKKFETRRTSTRLYALARAPTSIFRNVSRSAWRETRTRDIERERRGYFPISGSQSELDEARNLRVVQNLPEFNGPRCDIMYTAINAYIAANIGLISGKNIRV